MILTLVAGTALLMWIGELISQRGIGNGMSMIIFASVVSRLPYGYYAILQEKKLVLLRSSWWSISLVILVAVVLRRARPAAHPGAVRQARGRPADVRRPEHLHPAEGQPARRHPDHLRQLGAAAAGAHHQPARQLDRGLAPLAITQFVNKYIVNSQNLVYTC